MKKSFPWILLVGLVMLLPGCATMAPEVVVIKLYPGPQQAGKSVAVLTMEACLGIKELDGKDISHLGGKKTKTLLLLPGPHSVRIFYMGNNKYSINDNILNVNLDAGHTYILRANEQGLIWQPGCVDLGPHDKKTFKKATSRNHHYPRFPVTAVSTGSVHEGAQ